jgi:hypothetical protein
LLIIDIVHNVVDLLNSHRQNVVFCLYGVSGMGLCLLLKNKLRNLAMQDVVLCREKGEQQIDAEESAHFRVMTLFVFTVMMPLLRLFCHDIIQFPATVWGYFAIISYTYSVVYFCRSKLLLPLFKSNLVSLMVWLGVKLETEIHKEGVWCVLIAALLLVSCILNTVGVIPTGVRVCVFMFLGTYYCFRDIALIDGPLVYTREVDSIKQLRSAVSKLNMDDRNMFLSLLFSGLMGIALVGQLIPAPDLDQRSSSVKGCVLIVKKCIKLINIEESNCQIELPNLQIFTLREMISYVIMLVTMSLPHIEIFTL